MVVPVGLRDWVEWTVIMSDQAGVQPGFPKN